MFNSYLEKKYLNYWHTIMKYKYTTLLAIVFLVIILEFQHQSFNTMLQWLSSLPYFSILDLLLIWLTLISQQELNVLQVCSFVDEADEFFWNTNMFQKASCLNSASSPVDAHGGPSSMSYVLSLCTYIV